MHVPSIRRTLATASILAVTAGSLAACGGNDASGDGGSSKKPAAASSPSPSAANADAPLDKAGLIRAITVGQAKAGSEHVEVTLTGTVSGQVQGDVKTEGGQPSAQMTMKLSQLAGKQIELRLVDGIVFIKIPQLTPAGKFLRVDPKDKSNPLSKSLGSLTDQADPLSGFQGMKSAVRKVTYVGKQDIDGTPTTHYKVTVDGQALLKEMKQKSVPQMPKTVTYDMWLNQKNLLRRATYDVAGLHSVLNITEYGKKVDVQAPPKSDQVDSSKLPGATTGS